MDGVPSDPMTPDIPHLTVTQSLSATTCSDLSLDGRSAGFVTGPLAKALAFLAPVSKAQIDAHLAAWREAGHPRPYDAKAAWAPVRRQSGRGTWVTFLHGTVAPDTLFTGVWLVPLDSIVTEPPAPETKRVYAIEAILAKSWIIAETAPVGTVFQGDLVRRTLDGESAIVVPERGSHYQVVADDGTVGVLA